MTRLQAIENALSSLGAADFQELCDCFLALRHKNYSAFIRSGSQSGKQKTVKGTPDTFILLPNNNYIFIEYSTNVTLRESKLKDDVKKCLDSSKTGIQLNKIEEIILCINFNLSLTQVQSISELLGNTRISLTIHSLNSLALELNLNHRDLCNKYLGLPLDTGQIVSVEKFIAEYDNASTGIATPLNNSFRHREQELNELKEAIDCYDFIILTGKPGIGKTKLALTGIESFLHENLTFNAYCLSYKHHTLLEDLHQQLDPVKDYILFVDDANRIDAFSQIIGFCKSSRIGKLKIIITVRDYAFRDVLRLCQEFSFKKIDLLKLSDLQITDIIKAEPFTVLNQDYQQEICRIADGNPRLAIMATLLAKAEQNIYALNNVSDLFEKYFSTFTKDEGEFDKVITIQCLGLIAFFYTIPYKNKEITEAILFNFELDYYPFIETIDKLNKMELVEIQFEHVKITEQNIATYFFYKAFVRDNLLSFEILLEKYFNNNRKRFSDCVIPANNTFGPENVMNKLRPMLQSYWNTIKHNEQLGFDFLSAFWFYLLNETLQFIYDIINSLPKRSENTYEVVYENNAFSFKKNNLIEILGNLFEQPTNLKDTIELCFELARKKPELLPEIIHKIRQQLTFNREDQRNHFLRQNILFDILINGLNKKDLLLTICFYELSKTFLAFEFIYARSTRKHSISLNYYNTPNASPIQEFRNKIWNAIDIHFSQHPELSLELLKLYGKTGIHTSKSIVQSELELLFKIITTHLTSESFEHCLYVQDQIRFFKRQSISHPLTKTLKTNFINLTYKFFLKINWDRFRDKESYEFENHEEYTRLKEKEVRTAFLFSNRSELQDFYETFNHIRKVTHKECENNTSLDIVIDENCSRNFKLGCQLIAEVIRNKNEVNYIPWIVFSNHLKTKQNTEHIWNILNSENFAHKELWELSFYYNIESSLINEAYIQRIINTIKRAKGIALIQWKHLKKFLKVEPNLIQIILREIVETNEIQNAKIQLWNSFFDEKTDKNKETHKLIQKAYLQQDNIQKHFDYDGSGLKNILSTEPGFLLEYVKSNFHRDNRGLSYDRRSLGFIWKIEGIEGVLIQIFDFVIKNEPYLGIGEHFCNSFSLKYRTIKNTSQKTF